MKKLVLAFMMGAAAMAANAQVNYKVQTACHPQDVKHYDTELLRSRFMMDKVMAPDEINVTYTPVIFHKEITVIGPVTRISIIDAQVNDHNISGKVNSPVVFILLHIRPVPLIQQRSTGLTEVFNLIGLSQHFL